MSDAVSIGFRWPVVWYRCQLFQVIRNSSQTQFSPLTLKQVEQLQIELVRMKSHLSDRKHYDELQYYHGQI